MTKLDGTLSETLRYAADTVLWSCPAEDDDDQEQVATLRALADRLELEGEPRFGDLVFVKSFVKSEDGTTHKGIVVDDLGVECCHVFLLDLGTSWDVPNEELRIIARAGYDCESGRELTP